MSRIVDKLRRGGEPGPDDGQPDLDAMLSRIQNLEREVQECRRVNRRLADLVDVVAELLVPALARDDARVAEALARLDLTG
jgi:hypothetical protein